MIIFFCIVLIIVVVALYVITAIKAHELAEEKGYDCGGTIVVLSLFGSPLLAMIFVAAMPDIHHRENVNRIRTILEDMKASSEESSQDLVDIKELLADSLASKERSPKTKMKTKMRARAHSERNDLFHD
ncbi:MAG: hypothetical protein IJE25_04100 [Clostridia bacterium]|nr:hypothetical protein [Clostridia bacterium]